MTDQKPKMTPKEALAILDNASSMANLPRQNHVLIIEALRVLSELVNNSEKNK